MRIGWTAVILVGLAVLTGTAGAGGEEGLPEIVDVVAPQRLAVGAAGEVRLTYRAPQGNVVAIIQEVEDLDGAARRSTRQRELGVVARAFGRETGELTVPLSFATPGLKLIRLRLVTDERELSEPAVIEVEAIP